MDWLNYHHLLYFWLVVREGSLVGAGKVLRLTHPTLSAQVHALEDALGEQLFVKQGRRLVLTDMGRVVFRYADDIFRLGREMVDTVRGRATGQPLRLNIGVADVVPKLVVRQLLEPALTLPEPVRLVCSEGAYEHLLGDLATYALDLVISDAPVPAGSSVRAFHHLLGESGVTLFGSRALVKACARNFPRSLDGAPMVLPLEHLPLRRSLNQWFERQGVKPRVIAEFEDSALLKVFGSDGLGLFPAPTVVEREVRETYGVEVLARLDVRERFYAISVERRLKHPAVLAILEGARLELFGQTPAPGRRAVTRRSRS